MILAYMNMDPVIKHHVITQGVVLALVKFIKGDECVEKWLVWFFVNLEIICIQPGIPMHAGWIIKTSREILFNWFTFEQITEQSNVQSSGSQMSTGKHSNLIG